MQIRINDLTRLMEAETLENNFDVSIVTVNALKIIKDGVFILRSKTLDDKAIEQCDQAIERGAVAIISEMQIKDYPCIITQDCMVAYSTISRFYREKLDTKMTSAFNAVYELAQEKDLFMRDAAYVIAIKRVVESVEKRGWV